MTCTTGRALHCLTKPGCPDEDTKCPCANQSAFSCRPFKEELHVNKVLDPVVPDECIIDITSVCSQLQIASDLGELTQVMIEDGLAQLVSNCPVTVQFGGAVLGTISEQGFQSAGILLQPGSNISLDFIADGQLINQCPNLTIELCRSMLADVCPLFNINSLRAQFIVDTLDAESANILTVDCGSVDVLLGGTLIGQLSNSGFTLATPLPSIAPGIINLELDRNGTVIDFCNSLDVFDTCLINLTELCASLQTLSDNGTLTQGNLEFELGLAAPTLSSCNLLVRGVTAPAQGFAELGSINGGVYTPDETVSGTITLTFSRRFGIGQARLIGECTNLVLV